MDAPKKCWCCRQVRPVEDFNPDPSRKGGRHSICKECGRAVRAAHRRANPELVRAYRERPEERAKQRARDAAKYARRRGRLIAQPCAVCGDPRVHAHHPNYAKRLEVVWLCQIHHAEVHRRERAEQRSLREVMTAWGGR
jgi:hypothetical protein